MISIDKYAYFSGLKETNPLPKILFGGLSLIACVCCGHFLSFAIVFTTMFFITVFKAKIPLGYYLKLLALPLGFLVLGVIGILVNVTRSPLPVDCVWTLNLNGLCIFVSKTGLSAAILLVCKSMAAVSCLYFIILTTPFRDIIHFLHLLKCPKIIVTLSVLIYQFLFLLLDIADIKLKSQRCRGGYRSFRRFAKTFAMLWGSVFIQGWLKSRWAFKSMQSRGYDGHLKFLPGDFRINAGEIAMVSFFLLAATIPDWIAFLR